MINTKFFQINNDLLILLFLLSHRKWKRSTERTISHLNKLPQRLSHGQHKIITLEHEVQELVLEVIALALV